MSQTRAQEEPWWDEFVRDYGDVPLRELARRYGTNPRRLRRAAQRSGLSDEPLVLRKNTSLLGSLPDATVAERLGVTREAVQGARARRRIRAYDNRASQKRKSRGRRRFDSPRPKRSYDEGPPKRRFRPDDAPPPVVVSRGPRRPSSAGTDRLGARKLGGLVGSSGETERPRRRESRRRRIVSGEGREGRDKKDGPAPADNTVWRRKPRKEQPAPVRVVYDKKLEAPEPPPPPPVAAEPVQPPPPPELPKPEPPPAPAAPKLLWQARVQREGQARDVVIMAVDLAEAAAHAEEQGTVLALGRAALLPA